ncbi:hypothetical protein [Brachyspira sp.]|uniref:hypothetical protein n=1 Tax=Brachyspira sp. TaxID=1977261 RepID=UPI00262DA951|nr:hypothetical protein [Brachyspira sp.]
MSENKNTLLYGNSPAVVGNPIREIPSDQIKDHDLSMLFVTHGDSYDEKELIRMPSTDTMIKLHCGDNLKDILSNSKYPNCYTALIPHIMLETNTQIYPKLTADGHKAILTSLPNLKNINAESMLVTDGTKEPRVWKVTYYFDGKFAIQEALFCGLEFIRWAVDGNVWGSWTFKNDQNLIGTMRLDYIDVRTAAENTFVNRMGWISTNTTITLTQYPRLYRHIEKNWTNSNNGDAGAVSVGSYWKDEAGGIHIHPENGFYPRFVGDGTYKGVRSNPDYPNAYAGDVIDDAVCISINNAADQFIEYDRWLGPGHIILDKGGYHGQTSTNITKTKIYANKMSYNETRSKCKFFVLLIYAGCPA